MINCANIHEVFQSANDLGLFNVFSPLCEAGATGREKISREIFLREAFPEKFLT
jgi:hypothetical protein